MQTDGHVERAVSAYQQALEADPNFEPAAANLMSAEAEYSAKFA